MAEHIFRASDVLCEDDELIDRVRAGMFGGHSAPLHDVTPDTAIERRGPFDKGAIVDDQPRDTSITYSRLDLYRSCTDVQRKVPEIARSGEIYADYIATGSAIEAIAGDKDSTSKVYRVSFDDEQLVDEIKEVEQRTKIAHYSWDIAHGMVGWGDVFVELIYNDMGLTRLAELPRHTMFRRELPDGQLDLERSYVQRTTEFYTMVTQDIEFNLFQIAHFRQKSSLKSGYGESILYSLIEPATELYLMTQALTVARLTKAHRRLVMKVAVANQTELEAENTLRNTIANFRKRRVFDPNSLRVSLLRDTLLEEEDLFVATGNQPGLISDIGVLPGDASIGNIADIIHAYRRVLAGIRIPEAWLGLTGPNIRNVIDEQVLSFMRAVRRMREYLEETLASIYYYGLISYGISTEYIREHTLRFNWPAMTHADDEAYIGVQVLRADLATKLKETGIVSDDSILMSALGFDETKAGDMVARMRKQREEEALFAQRFGIPNELAPIQPKLARPGEPVRPAAEAIARLSETDTQVRDNLDALAESVRELLGERRAHRFTGPVASVGTIFKPPTNGR